MRIPSAPSAGQSPAQQLIPLLNCSIESLLNRDLPCKGRTNLLIIQFIKLYCIIHRRYCIHTDIGRSSY